MKILVACDGSTLDSRVAKRFERAEWFLIAESTDKNFQAIQNLTPHDHHTIVDTAARENVQALVAGKFVFGSAHRMSLYNLRVAIAHNMTAREAIEKINRKDLILVEAAHLRHLIEEKDLARRGRNLQFLKGQNRAKTGLHTGNMRAQHHLQQYSGRGH
ncbi:MAG: hypothetical protein HY708_05065 [Ignavibacteriae bacterium]|nr:hypothetical protein [Ignavibacteriota bacterium]